MIKTPAGLEAAEKDLYISGYKWCDSLVQKGDDIKDAVEATALRYQILISDIGMFKDFLLREITVSTEPEVIIRRQDIKDKTWWDNLLSDETFFSQYWTRYYDYLNNKPSWSLRAVMDLNDSTDHLLNLLPNPRAGIADERMGIVFGYVQSGKTAHYIGLINKAYDAGYRIVIVLSGIHNSLRSQTQSRIDEEVLGYETSLEEIGHYSTTKNVIGVAIGRHNEVSELVQSVTTRDDKGDFNAKTEGASLTPPLLIVTKKNASVLRRIIRYFKRMPYAEVDDSTKYIPEQYPTLIIDDEADQASINTHASYDENGNVLDDYNPTTINGLIRELFQLFRVKAYVGYTATPFANIFIPPRINDSKYGKDLYPRDFIIRAPRADLYIGGREFFGLSGTEDSPSMPLCEIIDKGANYLAGANPDAPVGELPDELKKAIKFFLISTAVRNCRGQRNKPNTMLVHIVRFIKQQNKVKKRIIDHINSDIKNMIVYGDNTIYSEFKKIWEENYCIKAAKLRSNFSKYMDDCEEIAWEEVWKEIVRLIHSNELVVYCVNGKSEDALIYKNHEGEPFNVIVVGGDKLSRGLTLEGLTISYFTRGANTYDTLMQMGRWFGFRPGYLDLCRLFTTKQLKGYFAYISMATEEMADQFDYMNDIAQSTPEEFGLRVATHPELAITSPNKLKTGAVMKCDFSAKLTQTRMFDIDAKVFENNFIAVESLLLSIKNYSITPEQYRNTHGGRNRPGNHYFWEKVPAYDIISFFESYLTSRAASRAKSKYIADYIKVISAVGGAKEWTVCLLNISSDHEPSFTIAGLSVGAGICRSEDAGVTSFDNTCSIHVITSAGHEYYDYTQDQLDKVDEISKTYSNDGGYKKNEYIRSQTRPFEKGLLLLYPIAEAGDLTKAKKDKTPFGFAAVFPDRKGKGDLKTYRMTEIAIKREKDELY